MTPTYLKEPRDCGFAGTASSSDPRKMSVAPIAPSPDDTSGDALPLMPYIIMLPMNESGSFSLFHRVVDLRIGLQSHHWPSCCGATNRPGDPWRVCDGAPSN